MPHSLSNKSRSEWKPTDGCILWPGERDSSPKESPDRGRKKIEAKWLARIQSGNGPLLPSAEIGVKKMSFWNRGHREQMGANLAPNSG